MSKRRPNERARSARRAAQRAADKLTRQRERLFELEPGGSPERPIDVDSPSVVEIKAAGFVCPRCDSPVRVEEHLAPRSPGMRLREAVVACPGCGSRRSLWFRLAGPSLN